MGRAVAPAAPPPRRGGKRFEAGEDRDGLERVGASVGNVAAGVIDGEPEQAGADVADAFGQVGADLGPVPVVPQRHGGTLRAATPPAGLAWGLAG